jgi:predicted small secreted protein
MEHDQESEIRKVSTVFAQEKYQHGKTKESWHVQDKSCGEKTETRRSVFQAEISQSETSR